MGIVVAATLGLVAWVVLWAIGAKGFDNLYSGLTPQLNVDGPASEGRR